MNLKLHNEFNQLVTREAGGFAIIAHRLGSLGIDKNGDPVAENTLEAMRRSYELGVRVFEVDIRASSDGTLFAMHDTDLTRVANHNKQISQLKASQIHKIKLKSGQNIPTLKQIVDEFTDALIMIDIRKDGGTQTHLITFLSDYKDQLDRFMILAFKRKFTDQLRGEFGSRLAVSGTMSALLLSRFLFIPPKLFGYERMQTSLTLRYKKDLHPWLDTIKLPTPSTIKRYKKSKKSYDVWTINDPDQMRRLIKMGVSGIMTDYPETLINIAKEEGVI